MNALRTVVIATALACALAPALVGAGTPNGQKGYEGQPGNQGSHGGGGSQGYEGQPGNQGGH